MCTKKIYQAVLVLTNFFFFFKRVKRAAKVERKKHLNLLLLPRRMNLTSLVMILKLMLLQLQHWRRRLLRRARRRRLHLLPSLSSFGKSNHGVKILIFRHLLTKLLQFRWMASSGRLSGKKSLSPMVFSRSSLVPLLKMTKSLQTLFKSWLKLLRTKFSLLTFLPSTNSEEFAEKTRSIWNQPWKQWWRRGDEVLKP